MRTHLLPLVSAISVALSPLSMAASEESIETVTVTGKYTVNKSIDTATGLGLTLRETPQSVTVFTAERIKDQNLNNIIDAVNNATGLSSTQLDNVRNNIQSRGFDVKNYQIDEVPLSWSIAGDAGETSGDVSIYERVEFVRGATGLMTGVGDPSASINLVRKRADQTELTGYVDVDAGSWDKKQITADIATGLNASGSIRGRIVARHLDSNSYIDYFEDTQDVFYGVLEADITQNTFVRVGGYYQNRDPKGATWGGLPALYSDSTPTNWDTSKTTATEWTGWETTNKNYFTSLYHTFDNSWELKVNYNYIEFEKDSKTLLVNGSVDKATGMGLAAQRFRGFGSTEQESVDLQLKGDYQLFNKQHEFVLGALYSEQDGTSSTYDPDPLVPDPWGYDSVNPGSFYQWGELPEPNWTTESTLRDDNHTEQTGYYAATRFSATENLKLIAGARLASWERQRVYYGVASDYGDDNVVVPYAGILYDLNEQHRTYVSYTEIFMPQNYKDRSGNTLDPLTGTNIEVGLKSAFLSERLQTSIAIFQIKQDNLAQASGDLVQGTTESAYYAAQGTESKGFEIEVTGQLNEGWDISAGYSLFKAEDAEGEKVNTTSPRKMFKLFTTYQFVDSLPALTIGGGVNWQSESYAEGSGNLITQDDYALVNLMARYEITSNISLQLNVDNLFDEKYYSYMTAGYYNQYRYGTPRNANLRFSYNF